MTTILDFPTQLDYIVYFETASGELGMGCISGFCKENAGENWIKAFPLNQIILSIEEIGPKLASCEILETSTLNS